MAVNNGTHHSPASAVLIGFGALVAVWALFAFLIVRVNAVHDGSRPNYGPAIVMAVASVLFITWGVILRSGARHG